jgi:hypothetical protein
MLVQNHGLLSRIGIIPYSQQAINTLLSPNTNGRAYDMVYHVG